MTFAEIVKAYEATGRCVFQRKHGKISLNGGKAISVSEAKERMLAVINPS